MSEQLRNWLWTLFAAEPDGVFVEIRSLGRGRSPHREFVPIMGKSVDVSDPTNSRPQVERGLRWRASLVEPQSGLSTAA